jgi:hypothetical protein
MSGRGPWHDPNFGQKPPADLPVVEPLIELANKDDYSGTTYVEVTLKSGNGQPDKIYFSLTDDL